jgi:hypothetical protein
MSSETISSKLGTAIYLKSRGPFLAALESDFKKRWPDESLINKGKHQNCALFTIGDFQFVIELRDEPIPQDVTNALLPGTIRHWPTAEAELKPHAAHLKIATTLRSGKELDAASALAKMVVSVLCVTDSIGVCWLNGPVLHPAKTFVAIANEMFGAGVPPLILWVGVHWKPQERIIHTKGMGQFDAPEIFINLQSEPSPEWVEYIFEVAYYAMNSGTEIHDGETMDGPNGVLRINSICGGDDHPQRTGLVLVPVQAS